MEEAYICLVLKVAIRENSSIKIDSKICGPSMRSLLKSHDFDGFSPLPKNANFLNVHQIKFEKMSLEDK